MRLKVFRAPDMAGAMACVREALGAEALILATRRTRDGVEITAALEPETVVRAPSLHGGGDRAEATRPSGDPRVRAALQFHGVAEELRPALLGEPLESALAGALRFGALDMVAGGAPLVLIGPPGAGKTLTVARLATRLVLGGVMPMVITADGRRAGAMEQLCAFTRLLGVGLVAASHPVTLARALAARPADAPVLIDTPGFDPFDPAQRDEIADLLAASGGTAVQVLPAGLDVAEAADLAGAGHEMGARHLVGTRFDLARRLGGILAAGAVGLALAEAGIGPGAADGLAALTPDFLAERLLRAVAAPTRGTGAGLEMGQDGWRHGHERGRGGDPGERHSVG